MAAEVSHLIPNIADIVGQYLTDESTTHWHRALSDLNTIPERIPPLPDNISKIMEGKCPIYPDKAVKDTHVLALIPQEFGTLNRLEENILRPYGKAHYPKNENPLQFRNFWDVARQKYADVLFPDTHWVLMTKDVLPGSRNKRWTDQVALVNALRNKVLVDYQIPTLQEAFGAMAVHKVATGKSLYEAGNAENNTYTRVTNATINSHLIVGSSAPSGVDVLNSCDSDVGPIGVAVLWKL